MLRPVVFDMDGVLVDSEPIYKQAFCSGVSALGRPELAAWFPNTLGRRQMDFLDELATVIGRDRAEVGARLDVALQRALARERPAAMPHVAEAIAALSKGGRIVGLASSSTRDVVDGVLRTLGLARSFTAVATGDEVAQGKPAPDVYLLAASRMAVSPSGCVALEDTPAGVAAANAAGMTAIAVPNALTRQLDFGPAAAVAPDLRAAARLILGLRGSPALR